MPSSIEGLIFPTASDNFSKTLAALKRSTLSVQNRLRSIEADAKFVKGVADNYGLPIVANERCGSWYIAPVEKHGSAYFKSTDGHQGQWRFSTRRLNLQLATIIGEHDGKAERYLKDRCIIVDSTRRGKSMPDALSKTIPIWCVVMNRLLFPEITDCQLLHTPSDLVGASEHTQIEAKLEGFVTEIKDLKLDINSLREKLTKPLLPVWITQQEPLPTVPRNGEYHYIMCCTASRRIDGAEMSEGGYIQGAGDDSEGWSHGLTPVMFWQSKEQLMRTPEEEIPEMINRLIAEEQAKKIRVSTAVVRPTNLVHLGALNANENLGNGFSCSIICGIPRPSTKISKTEEEDHATRTLYLDCGSGKLGSRALRTELQRLQPFIKSALSKEGQTTILLACSTGRDLSVGVALAVLCLYFADD
ncbi:MAG: hypothetical protein Q9187_001432, partial [Circinaria calcarea]